MNYSLHVNIERETRNNDICPAYLYESYRSVRRFWQFNPPFFPEKERLPFGTFLFRICSFLLLEILDCACYSPLFSGEEIDMMN